MIDSKILLDIVNDLTMIHNQIVQNNMFSAGFNLCILQQRIVNLMNQSEIIEKQNNLTD